jgi:hypothetical protein
MSRVEAAPGNDSPADQGHNPWHGAEHAKAEQPGEQELDIGKLGDGGYELDEEFHRLISECGASPKVWKLINGAKAQLDRVRRLVFPVNNHLDIVLAEHQSILDGLRRRDEDFAADAMQQHLNRGFDTIRFLISQKREYFASNSAEVAVQYGVRRNEAQLWKSAADSAGKVKPAAEFTLSLENQAEPVASMTAELTRPRSTPVSPQPLCVQKSQQGKRDG